VAEVGVLVEERGDREMVLWLEACCEVGTGRTPGPSDDVAEERRRPCDAQWGHDLSMGRTLEKIGPALYSPYCVEGKFCDFM
jgi:hypothetical protein